MRRALIRLASAVGAASLTIATGCASTQVRSGLAPGPVAKGYDQRWQAAFLFGALPAIEQHDLGELCPAGWAEIRLEADAFTGLAGLLTLFLYSPSRVTVVCAARARDALSPPSLRTYAVPGR